jgi:hypothetical protein
MAFTRPRASQINFDVTNISDPLLRINSNETGSADKDSGIVIERGNDQNVAIIYDESANQFTLVNTDEIGTTSGNVTIAGYAGLQLGALKPSGLTINSAYAFPTSDGSANQVLQTNGSGTLSFASISSTINLAGDSGTDAYSTGATLTFDGGTGIDTTVTNDQVSIAVSNAVALIASSLQLAGGTMSGAIAMGTNRITGVGDPVASQDAVTKAYFEANASSGGATVSGDTSTNTDFALYFAATTSGALTAVKQDTGLLYNPSTGTLTSAAFAGVASSAKYADLAEKYLADNSYDPGTVLVFGGDNEVTTTTQEKDDRVAGVVSTNPAYLMNSDLQSDFTVELALIGRVPCKVEGKVSKGQMLVTSSTPGCARVCFSPRIGTIIGKAVQDKTDEGIGIIEIAVGIK